MRNGYLVAIALAMVMLLLPGAAMAADLTVSGSIVKPDLVVTAISPNVGAGAFMFANEPNVISVTVKNQGTADAAASTLSVDVGGNVYTTAVGILATGASSTVTVTDTVSHIASPPTVTITATADSAGVIDEGNEANNVLTSAQTVYNNGYKGKRLTGGSDMNTQAMFDGRYGLVYSTGSSAYTAAGWSSASASWTSAQLPIPAGATVVSARLYQGYTFDQTPGGSPLWTMTFDGATVTPATIYTDRKGYGTYDYPSGLYVYDVKNQFNPAGNSMTIASQAGNNNGIYGAYMVVVYQDAGTTVKKIWINDECDLLYSGAARSVSNDEATTYATFAGVDTTGVTGAKVIAIAPSADEVKTPISSTFFFNTQTFATAIGTGYLSTPQVAFTEYNVASALTSGANTARMQSTISGTSGDNMVATNAIFVVEKAEAPVSADFTPVTTQTGDKPYTVAFTDASTGYITSRLWTFGDGATSTDVSPSHTYTTRGTYDVSLTVTGVGSGNTNTKTRTGLVTVKEPAPVIDFTGTPVSGTRPLSVTFTATNTGGQVNAWDWDFGDGSTHSNVQSPTHVYQNEGTYTVTLTATGPDYTAVKTRSGYIQVGAAVISVTITPAGVNFGTMQAGVDSTGSTQVAVTTTGGTGWTVKAADGKTTNKGFMVSGTTPLANAFRLANGGGSFNALTSDITSFMTGTADEDRTDTANVKQTIASSDGPGSYSITITFTPSFN